MGNFFKHFLSRIQADYLLCLLKQFYYYFIFCIILFSYLNYLLCLESDLRFFALYPEYVLAELMCVHNLLLCD